MSDTFVTVKGIADIPSGNSTDIADQVLPAGSYAVSATATGVNTDNTQTGWQCQLYEGSYRLDSVLEEADHDYASLALSGGFSSPHARQTVHLDCSEQYDMKNDQVWYIRIVATQVSHVTTTTLPNT